MDGIFCVHVIPMAQHHLLSQRTGDHVLTNTDPVGKHNKTALRDWMNSSCVFSPLSFQTIILCLRYKQVKTRDGL